METVGQKLKNKKLLPLQDNHHDITIPALFILLPSANETQVFLS